MNNSLRYISISHKTASVIQREYLHISEEEKTGLTQHISHTFPDISGLLLLITCNRTEIYFESEISTAVILRDFLISLKISHNPQAFERLFVLNNNTEITVKHLLEVSSGLMSSILGDAEIIHQIKKAYQFSIAHRLHGSLLERAMQTVFKNHKRVTNETYFRDGTTSIAYKTLKVVHNSFIKTSVKTKRILFIGAGSIVEQLFKYNSKFNFKNIFISNRTEQKASALAYKYHSRIYHWNRVLMNDFQDFDIIISAVGNYHHLIKNISSAPQKVLLVDLAMPSNVDKVLALQENTIFYNLDSISSELEETKERRLAAIDRVREIIFEELLAFNQWLQKSSLRMSLAKSRAIIDPELRRRLLFDIGEYDNQTAKMITDRIMRKLIKQNDMMPTAERINVIINKEVLALT